MRRRISWDLLRSRFPALFPLILMLLAIAVNFRLQPNMFELDTLNQNMRVFLPLILLAAGQAVVLLGGGIDISAGAVLSIVNTILATQVGLTGSPDRMWQFIGISLLVGIAAGAFNGFFISYLRLQPIITTYATSFLYAGVALLILPNPGGGIPAEIAKLYRDATPLGAPLAFYVIAAVLLIWLYFSSSRYGKYLFAAGGKPEAAYETAVPVTRIQFGIYVVSGLMAALAGIAISMLTAAGNAEIGAAMTLNAITAVVIGGNAFSGGIGGVAGPVMGAIALSVIQNIVSFAHINTWWETLVKAAIIVGALAAPGVINLFRRRGL